MVDAGLGEKQVTLELEEQPLDRVLGSLARHLGTNYHQASPTLYFIGATRPQDRSVLVRRVRGLGSDQISQAISTVGTDTKIAVYPDGLIVVSGLPETLQRVSQVLDEIESSRPGVWVVQLYLVTMTRDDLTELGLDVTPALDVALTYGIGSQGISAGELNVGLSALLTAARSRSSMGITAEPLFYLIDGEQGHFERATTIPIAKRSVSDQGTVTTTGYQSFQAGTFVDVSLREMAGGAVRLEYDIELSILRSVTEDGFPSSDNRGYSGKSLCQSGGVYLLGAIDLTEDRTGRGTWLHSGVRESHSAEVMQIWARCVAVQGPAFSCGTAENVSIDVLTRSNQLELTSSAPGVSESSIKTESNEAAEELPLPNPLRKESQE